MDGGQFFVYGDIMEIKVGKEGKVLLAFDEKEWPFIEREAEENDLTVEELIVITMSRLFVGGYKLLAGME